MILADFGADVVRVEQDGAVPDDREPAWLLLHRGKRSIGLDLATGGGRSELQRLVLGADVLIETRRPGSGEGHDISSVVGVNPSLVHCVITPFGPSGAFAHLPPDDALVLAKAGIFRDQPGWHRDDGRPVYRASKDASYFAAMLSVQGVLAALRTRDRIGKGQRVETSLLQALTCRQNPSVRWLLREGEELPPAQGPRAKSAWGDWRTLAHHRDPREVSLTGMLLECKDGRWLQHALAQPKFFPAWIDVIGFDWIWHDTRFKGAPHRFDDPADKLDLAQLLEKRLKEKTAEEWMGLYLENGEICAEVVETTQEALRHPQVVQGGFLVHLEDPRVGDVVQIGPLAMLPQAPPSVCTPAPRPRQHTGELVGSPRAPILAKTASCTEMRGPLDGVTILEAASYYATPFASALLAELGARVIKIEPITGDHYRLPYTKGGDDPVARLGHNNMVRAMQGKESIAVDMKDPRGREIVHRLVARADAFVHNFRPGVPESLGVDYDTLRQINPGLVYQCGSSYGTTGPYALQPAIDPVVCAFSGQTAYQAGNGNPPLAETGADPIAAAGHAVAMMLALTAKERTGVGQYVESPMIVSNLFANCEDALCYKGKPDRPRVDAGQFGTSATHRLYETKPPSPLDDHTTSTEADAGGLGPRWVFLASEQDHEFARFCEVAGCDDLVQDSRFATAAARSHHRHALEALMEPLFRTRTAEQWETELVRSGVGCVTADAMSHFNFLHSDPQARAVGLMIKAEHPAFGTYWRHSPLIEFSETPGQARPFCELGEHTIAVLEEFGFNHSELESLREAKVIMWPSDAS
jgi:crotonobetainyl-CoA:carnitine CoA-transferase CaiB-like acyl-CoA transferase